MMFKIIILILVMFQITGFTQEQKPSTNLIVRVQSEVDLDFIHENITGYIYLRYKDYKDIDKPRVAIRLCSTEPIQLALVKSALSLPAVLETFAILGYPNEKIVVLKSKDCISKYTEVTTAEVWTIFPNFELPSYDEKYLPNEIDITRIGDWMGMEYLGNPNYIQNTYKVVEELEKDKSAIGVVLGVYRKNPKDINKKFSRINKLLKNSGLDNSRYIFQVFRWRQELSLDPLEKGHIYPAFFVVKIHKL